MQKSILSAFPKADISVSIVWIQMPGFDDNAKTAAKIAGTFDDPRVKHFFDPLPGHLAGKAFAKGILKDNRGPAWDIYFFYEKGRVWEEAPPKPDSYLHQLGGGGRADSKRFRTGEDLIRGLRDGMKELTGTLQKDRP